jgi:hypothetical protein
VDSRTQIHILVKWRPYVNLSRTCFMLSPWLPECYVNQNSPLTRRRGAHIIIINGAFVKYTSRGKAASGDEGRNLTHCLKKGERLRGEGTNGCDGDADSAPKPPVWIIASSLPSALAAAGGNTSRGCWSESGPGISRTPSSARFP